VSSWWTRVTRIRTTVQGNDAGLLQNVRQQAASTEDFKSIVEKHMTRGMDLDANTKWIGSSISTLRTAYRNYNFRVSLEATADGKTTLRES